MNEAHEYETYLDPRDLRLLDALYTTRSVTRTAELMGQNQSSVSTWLKGIRDRLKDPLFVRTSQGMTPTPRAEMVAARAREILEALHQISHAPHFDPLASKRTFRMCIPDGAQTTLLPGLLRRIRNSAPLVRFEALPLDKNTPRLLENGDADLAFGGFVPVMVSGFYEQTLFEQGYICLVSAQHPRIRERLTIEDFEREAHVAFGYGRSFEVIESEMKQRKVGRRVMVYLPGVLGVAKIVASTDMITTLPGQIGMMMGRSSGAIRVFPCPVPLPNVVVKQFWHARFHHDSGHQWLRNICADEARSGMKRLLEGLDEDIPGFRDAPIE